MVSERKRFNSIDQLAFSRQHVKTSKSVEDLTTISDISPVNLLPPKPPKPHKPSHLSQPISPIFRNTTISCSDSTGTFIDIPFDRFSNQRKSEPIVPTLSIINKVEPAKPPTRPPKPHKPVFIPRISVIDTTDSSKCLKRAASSPSRRRANYSNFTLGEEDITEIKIHDKELSDFASHIQNMLEKASKERRISDVATFANELLSAPILTEEHLALQHSQKLKLFSLMVLTIEPNTEISSFGFDIDLSNKAVHVLVEKNTSFPKTKSSPTLINVILKSNAKDLISIFLQTVDSDYDRNESDDYLLRISGTQFYLKNTKLPLHRFQYIRYCLRRREAPRFMLEHVPRLYTEFCNTIYEEIDIISNEKFFENAFTDILKESCPELLYYQLLQVPVVYKTLLDNLEMMRESKVEGKEWMHIGKLKHLEQTIKLLTLQMGKFNSFLLENSLNQIFKLHSRHKNSGLDAKTKQTIANEIQTIILEVEDQVIMHIQAYSLLTKIPISLGSNKSIEQVSQTRTYQPNFPRNKNSNLHVWIGGIHRILDHQPTRPKLYYLEAVLMCGGNEFLTPTRSSYCRCNPGRFFTYIHCNLSLDLGVNLYQIPRECYLRISLHSQLETDDSFINASLKATGYTPIFCTNGTVNKHYAYIPLAEDKADFPCDYLALNHTENNLMLLEIQLQNIPKNSWDSLHQELTVIPEISNSNLNTSIDSEYCTLGSSFNTLGSSSSISFGTSTASSLSTSAVSEDSWKSAPSYSSRTVSMFNNAELTQHEEKYVTQLIHKDIFQNLSRYDRKLIWSQRLRNTYPHNLTTLSLICQSMPYCDYQARRELTYFLKDWPQERSPGLLQGLHPSIWQAEARNWIIDNISKLETETLCLMAPQLLYAVHYEPYHWNRLVELLLEKCQSSLSFAHTLFWILSCSIQLDGVKGNIKMRLLLIKSAILGLLNHNDRSDLLSQETLSSCLSELAEEVKNSKEELRKIVLKEGLLEILKKMPEKFSLPVNAASCTTGFKIARCNYFNSNAVPLRLSFINSDSLGEDITLMFKKGDDLRQDMLVLQIVNMMDNLWQSYGLDLNVLTFACKPTGKDSGFIELVKECETFREIQTQVGQGLMGSVAVAPLAQWLHRHNPTEELYKLAVETFTRSCAAWCVASYVLGLCDRHNDNIMLTRQGHIFHIDFGKILGHAQMFGKIKRDRAPFVLTPDMAYVIDGCEHSTVFFQRFIDLACYAYNILREHMNVFLGLIMLTLPAKMDVPNSIEDVKFVHDQLLPLASNDEATTHFTRLIRESRASLSTRLNFFVHSVAQLRSGKSTSNTPLLSFILGNYSKQTEPEIVNIKMKSFQKRYHPEKYYSYILEVTKQIKTDMRQFSRSVELCASFDQDGRNKEIIFRRFKEFHELHTKLQETFLEAPLPTLPAKIILGRSSVKTVAQTRFNELTRYIEELLALPPRISHCDLIYTFFHGTLRDRQDYVFYSTTHPCSSPLTNSSDCTKTPQAKLCITHFKDRGLLSVMVMHVRHLSGANITMINASLLPTTKVKLKLQLKNGANIKRKTHSVSNSPDPTFNESFTFNTQDSDITSIILNVSVKEMNLGNIICCTNIHISDLNFTPKTCVRWFELEVLEKGELFFK
ncbi:hypothetical protein LOD99_4392 [Oopsacas minuta]|uniref:Phosphatidylinositol-4-phosphate 3-kinase n=1 Tax=Oopsacas minuta TaxID=111878 RepID=A0AAV7JUN4_9METZ|nr:hypothetical protein LOD99_4392 [Oopsacas minuta]